MFHPHRSLGKIVFRTSERKNSRCARCRPHGRGDDKLGKMLMKGFVYALTQLEELPQTILLLIPVHI